MEFNMIKSFNDFTKVNENKEQEEQILNLVDENELSKFLKSEWKLDTKFTKEIKFLNNYGNIRKIKNKTNALAC